uniref:Uncharacterized protein n=1 Tax=Rhizophora mucronata TaxID=61149 RepID=A0A2P2IR73_RHIMU
MCHMDRHITSTDCNLTVNTIYELCLFQSDHDSSLEQV